MKLNKTRIEIPEAARKDLVALLGKQLANLADLHSQTKHAHWNVKGPVFWALHKLFDELAEKAEDAADEVAERLAGLGGIAQGTIRQAAAATELPEYPANAFVGIAAVKAVADVWGAAANSVRKGIDTADGLGDKVTADLLTQIADELDESLYFLEAHLNGE